MRRRYESTPDEANRQEMVDQLEAVIRLGMLNYFVKSGRYVAETAMGIGFVTMSRQGLESTSIYLGNSQDETSIYLLDKPNSSWTITHYLYKSNYDDDQRGEVDLLEASSSALSAYDSDEIMVFADFFRGAMKKIRKLPKNPNKLQ